MRLLKEKAYSSRLAILCLLAVILALVYWVLSSSEEPVLQTPQESALDFAVFLDKKSYKRNEPIQATFQLKNIGANPIIVKTRLALDDPSAPEKYVDIYCEIIRDDKDIIPFAAFVTVRDLRASDFVRLKSGDTVKTVVHNLQDFYRISDPGKYSIRAIYVNSLDSDDGLAAWKGEAKSEVKTFVIEP